MTEVAILSAASDLMAADWQRFGPRQAPVLGRLEEVPGVVEAWAERQTDWVAHLDATQVALERLWALGVTSIPITSPWYPPQLRTIGLPPLVLHVHGDRRRLTSGIAIVGSRRVSPAAEAQARRMAARCAAEGVPVITGMAMGTDQAAAAAALDAGGAVIGVVPGGPLDVVPKACRDEYRRAALRGCLVSEVTGRLPVNRTSFLRRNRITSGLARVVVVPSTGDSGGTINQLEWAQRQGRPSVVLDEGAPQDFRLNKRRLAYHWVGQDRLYEKTIDLWATPRLSAQSVLG